MNFVAQFRVVQRLIMLCTVIWIGVVIYKMGVISGVVTSLTSQDTAKPVYFNFDINNSCIPVQVREILNREDMQLSAASVLYQVRGSSLK